MEVTLGWTDTVTGALLTPAAVAVTVAVPVSGLPDASFPLQTTNVESQTPPHICPEGFTVTRLGFEELKVNTVGTVVADESEAEKVSDATCPDTIDTEAGPRVTTATVLFFDELPQPAMATAMSTSNAFRVSNHCIQRLKVIVGGKRILQSSFWSEIVQQETVKIGHGHVSGSTPPPGQRTDPRAFFCPVFWLAYGTKVILLVHRRPFARPGGAAVVDGNREQLLY